MERHETSLGHRLGSLLWESTKLGFTSFGGPIAHLAFFRESYVHRKKWLDEKSYADTIALAQFLPGPSSSQVGIAIGMMRGGWLGGIISWIGFTLPSILLLVLFAYLTNFYDVQQAGWLSGLKIAAVAVVIQAIIGMSKNLTPDKPRIAIAMITASFVLISPTVSIQLLLILLAAIIGYFTFKNKVKEPAHSTDIPFSVNKIAGVIALILFFALLLVLPILSRTFPNFYLQLFDTFYRVGSIVFGGGHVVLPLLEREVVPSGWITEEAFLAGYGAAQAIPGPLFTFASYLGMVISGWKGAVIATVAIFLPSFLLIIGLLPFWNSVRKRKNVQAALMGVNAAVVGILLAALYDPIWTTSINDAKDFVLALFTFALLMVWKFPAWFVVAFAAAGGALMSYI
ncbi:chromate transporter [Longirhabdus pacifica]|uniref:chromate transporter n=1 Tax=Longirhabdus pacifica TaxID=2305227 RepID=UPI001008A866|nr:chromate transporter [Longirhabdus pacifica]